MMKDSEVVEGAIDILDKHGWCRRIDINSDGEVCAGEALVEAMTGDRDRAVQTRRWQSQFTPQIVTVNQVTDQEIEELFYVHIG